MDGWMIGGVDELFAISLILEELPFINVTVRWFCEVRCLNFRMKEKG